MAYPVGKRGIEVGVTLPGEPLKELLRAHNLNVTAPRMMVLQVLQEMRGHLSAEDIYTAVLARYPAVNMVTVYRTLETFEEHGLAVRGTLGDKVTRWENVAQAHHHLVCRRCGKVVDLDDDPFQRLAADLAQRYGVRVTPRHLALEGLCPSCAAAGEAAPEIEQRSAGESPRAGEAAPETEGR